MYLVHISNDIFEILTKRKRKIFNISKYVNVEIVFPTWLVLDDGNIKKTALSN